MLFWLCSIVLASAVILGGGTHAGYLGDVAVQLMSVPLLAAALWPAIGARHPNRRTARIALWLCCAFVPIIGIQLLPLPFDFWPAGASLLSSPPAPGFEWKAAAWGTISLTPQATWAAAASSIVPLSIFCAVIQLGCRQRFMLGWLLLALGVIALALGFFQAAQGPASGLRFYDVTNQTEAVGFFANRNHFAAHLYISLVLAGVWFATMAEAIVERKTGNSSLMLGFTAAAVFLVAMLAGLALARSRAGLLLAMFALAGIVAIMLRQRRQDSPISGSRHLSARRASFAAIVFGILFAAQFGLGGIIARFESDPIEDFRVVLNRVMRETIPKVLPFGTGIGSFVPVYATAEKRHDLFAGYANRAHNDLAEFLLETGVAGAVLILAFLTWFASRAYKVWKKPRAFGNRTHVMFEQSATVVIVLLLAHSLVDYPLRTASLSAIFALFCAILAVPAEDSDAEPPLPRRRPQKEPHMVPTPGSGERWGSGVEWPDSWQKSQR